MSEARERVRAFGPGRVNLVGEHTDYNGGLCLPFAIAAGVTVEAERIGDARVEAFAALFDERDDFALERPERAQGWRAFVRGAVAELGAAGHRVPGARLTITSDLPLGSGLSSSAALEAAVCLALLGLAGEEDIDRVELAHLSSRVENEWVGAETGLLDQLASLLGREGHALLLDLRAVSAEEVPLQLGDWRLAILGSGEEHSHAASGYNQRREECRAACRALGVSSLREASSGAAEGLADPLGRRVAHVLGENERVRRCVEALRAQDLAAVGELLDASHESLRDLYDASTPAVESARRRCLDAGAAGARMVGGGFGGHVLGLFPPGARLPDGAADVAPGPGASLLP